MLMPETAVYENRSSPTMKNNIRFAGQIPNVQSVSVAKTAENSPQNAFRPRIPAAHTGHEPASSVG
jgi:hypothetical protein